MQFVTGRSGSGKTEYIRRQMAACTGRKRMLLVPEQYSFAAEKAMMDLAGIEQANEIQVISFTRLADLVFRSLGGVAGRRLSEGGRRVIMELAITACQDQLTVYNPAVRAGKLSEIMMNMVNEMKLCGILPEDLLKVAGELGDNGLSLKLREIAWMAQSYQALIDGSYLDARDDLTRLAGVLKEAPFFRGYRVSVDSFDGFTVQELAVLREILLQAEEVLVALCTDHQPETGTGLFSPCNRTKEKLKRLSRHAGVGIKSDVCLTKGRRFLNPSLARLEAGLSGAETEGQEETVPKYGQSENTDILNAQNLASDPASPMENPKSLNDEEAGEGIYIFAGRDVYQEVDYAAAAIRRLVMEEGLRYHEITIVCRNPALYSGCLRLALDQHEIPCFVSMPCPVDAEPVMRLVIHGMAAACHGYPLSSIFEMLKTGIAGFTVEEISALENYSELWKLKGLDFLRPFEKHPRGYGQPFEEGDQLQLKKLNALRRQIMAPLNRLEKGLASGGLQEKGLDPEEGTKDPRASRALGKRGGVMGSRIMGRAISEGIYRLLEDYKVSLRLRDYCELLEESGASQLAEKQVRVWDLLMEILDQMAVILGQQPVTVRQYESLLGQMIRLADLSEIPQMLDQVLFGTPEQVRQSNPRVIFALGMVQGEFPAVPAASGILSDGERRFLISEKQLPLTDALEARMMEERYLCYSVLTGASEKLYLSYPRAREGEETVPSELIGMVHQLFPGLQESRRIPLTLYANAKEAAFVALAANFRAKTREGAALREVFAKEAQYEGRVKGLIRAAAQRPERIQNQILLKKQYADHLTLSPSQIEVFHSCRFRYFCQYTMKAKERRPAEVDALQYGTMMHYLFERLLSQGREKLSLLSDGALKERLEQEIQHYSAENMGGFQALKGQEKYRLSRMSKSAVLLLRHLTKELAQSKFQPAHLEMQLGYGSAFPPLRIRSPEGNLVTVGGTVDRVDVYETPQGKFVRVVDYKTGNKKFQLVDVLYGLNLQMLIYLAALVETGELLPAGVLYTPLVSPSIQVEYGADEKTVALETERKLRMNGLILGDAEIVAAMEEGAEGRFIPAKLKKDGSLSSVSSAVAPEGLALILQHAKRLIATMADALASGHIEADPMMQGVNSCGFCPYGSVCGREYGEKDVQPMTIGKQEEVLGMMWEEEQRWQT